MGERLYTTNNIRRVDYTVDYIDPSFKKWMESRGGPKHFFDKWARLVTTGSKVDSQANSLPTGGRVLVYNLPEPFIDPLIKQPITEVDIKGVGLTVSGFERERQNLKSSKHQEVVAHTWRDDIYGPESLIEARASVENQNLVRRQGQFVPAPLAILRPSKLVFQGELIEPKDLANCFNLPEGFESEFALLVRGYVGTATRMLDLIDWYDGKDDSTNCVTPTLPVVERQDYVASKINTARRLFDDFERKKLARLDLVEWYKQTSILSTDQLAIQVNTGYTPCSGCESPDDQKTISHTHLQNRTLSGMNVEYAPATDMGRLPLDIRAKHFHELFAADVDFIAALGAACLPKKDLVDEVVTSKQQAGKVARRVGGEYLWYLNSYFPIERDTEKNEMARLISRVTRGDFYSRWLKRWIDRVI